ncbi:hypothetical protein ACOI1C_21515 [Bacillus sp. DJP31]|uniref:hypothetical protein n=1 Tax=Bacillus sp. DJP31 TaxID=3409789 RepID=UPI003BB70643
MKNFFGILLIFLILTGCTTHNEVKEVSVQDTDSELVSTEQPIRAWLKLENEQKNDLVIKVFSEEGLEMKDYQEHFRTVISEMDKGAAHPNNQNVTIQQALENQFKNVQLYIKNADES